jgi:hypothetical protein
VLDGKVALPAQVALLPRQVLDLCQGRGLAGEFGQEAVQRRRLSLDLDEHASGLVPDEAAKLQTRGQDVHEWPESNPPDDALNQNRSPFHDGLRCRRLAGRRCVVDPHGW